MSDLVRHQNAFLADVVKLIEHAQNMGFVVTGGELYRTPEQQELYVKSGRSETMQSNHLRRLAIDLNFFRDGELTYALETLRPLGVYWEALSPLNRWGGNFRTLKDTPHFERNV